MIQLGVTFNGKNSFNDFGLYIEEKHINGAKPKVNKDSVPYQNGQYDLNMIGTNNHIIYDTRTIVIKFLLISKDMTDLHDLYSSILEWLINTGQSQLIFDFMPDYYFLARVEDVPSFDEFVVMTHLNIVEIMKK
ncbi:MAG: putative phage tail component [Clostridiaceae bacterium]|nr:putative phage tail component [Clostridiaceae bacterium]